MKSAPSILKIKEGFKQPFWTANIMELFERIAYYGQASILSVFLRDYLQFNEMQAGQLSSIFGGLIYFLPIFAGALADKFGYRKSFSIAFIILAFGYFLIGSTGMSQFAFLYEGKDLYVILVIMLIFTAIGGSFIKPSVLGTVALTTTKETKSLGYAIYYWLVNIGGALGPLIAFLIRDSIGIQIVYMVSSISCLLMFFSTLIWYKNPSEQDDRKKDDFLTVLKNLFRVLADYKFMVFLFIFSLYWLMFWQIFIIIPFYIRDFISQDAPFELITSVGAWGIIALQLIVNRITKSLSPITAIIAGFFISTLCWAIVLLNPTIITFIAGIITFSIGEQTQAPRYYEYIADLAPKGQAALFQGYAFLPIAIGWALGGTLGGWAYSYYAKQNKTPETVFLLLLGVGVTATLLMFIYNITIKRKKS